MQGAPIRRVRVDDDLWLAYGEAVGMRKRSTDLKAYMEWRVQHPTTKLPGMRLLAARQPRRPKPAAE